MKRLSKVLAGVVLIASAGYTIAQAPVLSLVQAPYEALQNTQPIHLAGNSYSAGQVAYGPVGTPLNLTGASFGDNGEVWFVSYKNGANDSQNSPPVRAAVSLWSATSISVTVPSGAKSGLIEVISGDKESNGLPFLVTTGTYSASCTLPTQQPLKILTSSLSDGSVSHSYSTTLQLSGGTASYTWSLASGSLPTGLSLSSSGVISGTPSAATSPVSFTVKVTDSSSPSQYDTATLSMEVAAQPEASSSSALYSFSIKSSGGAEGYDPMGNVTAYTDSVNGTWTFAYDSLNRLAMGTGGQDDDPNPNYCWQYDGFGNRLSQYSASAAFSFGSGGAGSCTINGSVGSTFVATYNTNNQMQTTTQNPNQSQGYDTAGNITNDGINSYLYDAEGRICAVQQSVSGITTLTGYLYNAEGQRVAKGSLTQFTCDANPSDTTTYNGFAATNIYIQGPSGDQMTELGNNAGSGANPVWTWAHTNVNAEGLSATYDADLTGQTDGKIYFHLADWLGTRRQQTDYAGNPVLNFTGLPYGDGLSIIPVSSTNAADAMENHFTGKERDTESGNDYFGARYYASSMGRFMSPDWSAKQDPVPYARLDNPQTLNLYAYLRNNPLAGIDADGHCSGDDCGKVTVTATPEKQPAPVHETTVTDKDGNQHTGTGPTANLHMTVSVNGTPTDGVHVTETNQATMTTPTLTTTGRPVIDGTVDSKNGGKYADVVGPEIPSSKMSSAAAANAYNTTPVTLVDKQTQTLQIPGQGGQPGFTCEATSTRTVTNTADGKTISPNGYTLTTTQPVVRSPQPTQ